MIGAAAQPASSEPGQRPDREVPDEGIHAERRLSGRGEPGDGPRSLAPGSATLAPGLGSGSLGAAAPPAAETDAELIGEALNDGLEYFGHELDDVTGRVHAIDPRAKKYETALAALDRLMSDRARVCKALVATIGCADAAEARVEELTEALREAHEFANEAYDYGCAWPIGLDTDAQEQRGMARDTFIRNAEFYGERFASALAAAARPEGK